MAKSILIVRIPIDFEVDLENWLAPISEEYIVIAIYSKMLQDVQFEYPQNCNLPDSELEKIKEAILVP